MDFHDGENGPGGGLGGLGRGGGFGGSGLSFMTASKVPNSSAAAGLGSEGRPLLGWRGKVRPQL